MKKFEGNLVSSDIKIGIVCARFNEFITSKLLSGAMDGLLRHDVKEEDISVAREHLRFRWLPQRWRRAENTMRSSVLAQ